MPVSKCRYDETSDCGGKLTQFVQSYRDPLELYPREGLFSRSTLPPDARAVFKRANEENFVEPVTEIQHPTWYREIRLWRMTDAARERLDDLPDSRQMAMPCGHSGFDNPRDSDYLHCKQCNGRFTKEEVKGQ